MTNSPQQDIALPPDTAALPSSVHLNHATQLDSRWRRWRAELATWATCGAAQAGVVTAAVATLVGLNTNVSTAEPPRVLAPGYSLVEFAVAPQIVTPIAMTFDSDGHLLVIESHTHQRPSDYTGPEFDRIQRLRDTDGDGRADEITTFYEATKQTMSLVRGADHWVYVATRREIARVRDTDSDGRADEREVLVRLETKGDYPHNGISGMTWTPAGQLLFGMGENLGESYHLVGQDGKVLQGQGEGGNVFVCQDDGSQLQRHATGFWNPFGNAFDPQGRLFTVDNDPDASPPCRILQVVPGGDYGYQFRYGRSGRHPLQAWDAELPGTLPLAAGTGEAPCQIVPYRGRLWVTSWGDYRLEAYTLQAAGASCQARMETIVQGDNHFRPVGMAIAADGSLYFSDWVDRSYPVHGQGRVWHLIPTTVDEHDAEIPELSDAEQQAAQLRNHAELADCEQSDPFLQQAAAMGLIQHADFPNWKLADISSATQRSSLLQAVRWHDAARAARMASEALSDADTDVAIVALRIIAEQRLTHARAGVLAILDRSSLDDRLARVALATLAWLDSGAESNDATVLYERLASYLDTDGDQRASVALQRLAMRTLPGDHAALSTERLTRFLEPTVTEKEASLSAEAIRLLAARSDVKAGRLLAQFAQDPTRPLSLRCDAIAALAAHLKEEAAAVRSLTDVAADPALQMEAKRVLRQVELTKLSTVQAWTQDANIPAGDAAAGRRIFFRANGPKCYVCHTHDGQGGAVGPDLTTIYRRGDRHWLAAAIVDPSRDVAPKFTPMAVELKDGRTLTGLPLAGPGDDGQQTLIQSDGTAVSVKLDEIERQEQLNTSIMPTGLVETLSVDELSDLLAFLSG